MTDTCNTRGVGRASTLLVAVLLAVTSGPVSATEMAPPGVGAVAFAKISTNLSSSLAPYTYDAQPSDLGPFDDPRGLVSDNGLTSASASTPCSLDALCDAPTLVAGGQGEAAAAADLASGTLRVFALSNGRVFRDDFGFYVPLVQSEAFAGFRDILTALEDGTVHFDVHINGTDMVDPRDGGTGDYIDFLINGAPARSTEDRTLASNDGITGFGCGGSDPGLTSCDVDLLVDVPVLAGDQLDLSLLLGVIVQDGTADYSHTLSLTASGVQFSSASGVFLTALTPGVPEPSTWIMMLIGFWGMGYSLRLRKRRHSQIA